MLNNRQFTWPSNKVQMRAAILLYVEFIACYFLQSCTGNAGTKIENTITAIIII